MIREVVEQRIILGFAFSACAGLLLKRSLPFPEDVALLSLIAAQKPILFLGIQWCYLAMLFTTPFLGCSALFSLLYIFVVQQHARKALRNLPAYPHPSHRDRLFIIVGEVHIAKKPEPSEQPRWLEIPDRGLFTGIAVFGAIGSGKTSCCMYPFAEQVLAYRSAAAAKALSVIHLLDHR